MTQIQQEIINDKQLQCDLIEIGVTRAAGMLIKENMEAVDDEALTLQKVRLLSHKLNSILYAYDTAQKDVDDYKQFVAKSEEKEAAKQQPAAEVCNA